MSEVRTRFAPSPTGFLHIGGVRTALFAWLMAKHSNGVFILRFEDTDKQREVEGAKQHLIDCLNILGINYDEGPGKGGDYGPYVQSERLDIYKRWAEKLVADGRAYADPYTQEEVQSFRDQAQREKKPFLYRNHRPENTKPWDGSTPLRFRSDPKAYTWHDEVMGDLSTEAGVIDDFILMKRDGYPTYNFAHIVDDAEMKITHVMRGQEFLASVPNYLNLYEALNLSPPILATLPHVMGPGGGKKLSKRDGAKDVLDYIRDGYLPDALVSFIATLGWNDGTEKEIYSRQELIDTFSIDRIQKSGAQFDERRLLWTNGTFIRQLPLDNLYEKVEGYWTESAQSYDEAYKKKVLSLVQERLKYFAELPTLTNFFFEDLPIDMDLIHSHKQLKNMDNDEIIKLLRQSRETIEQASFDGDALSNALNGLLESTGQKPVVLFSLIRIATTSAPASPSLADTILVLGKERSLSRIDSWLNELDKK
ncbi:MAG: glutamate--tRNA ligase [Candidatus Saccharimonadales bacterium]